MTYGLFMVDNKQKRNLQTPSGRFTHHYKRWQRKSKNNVKDVKMQLFLIN